MGLGREADIYGAVPLKTGLAERFKAVPEVGGLEGFRGHDGGVFTIVGVVAFADADAFEAVFLVECDSPAVGNPDFQCHDAAFALEGDLKGSYEEELAEALASPGFTDGDGGNVGLVGKEPDADKA
jgi:hypothetical protein